MMQRIMVSSSTVLVLGLVVLGCQAADEEFKSGVPVGKGVAAFNPLNITGSEAGEKRCLV